MTVELPDAKDTKCEITPEGKFTYSATVGKDNTKFETELELFDKIDVEVLPFQNNLSGWPCKLWAI